MDKQTGPKGFLVVLPGEIIEIPQDSDKSWLTVSYVTIGSSCLCGTATHGAHGSSFRSKAARAITAIFPATGISAQDISPCGGYVNMSFMLCGLLFFSLQSTHLCNMKQNRYQNAAFGCFGLMPLYAPIFLPQRQ